MQILAQLRSSPCNVDEVALRLINTSLLKGTIMTHHLSSHSPEMKDCIEECWNCHSICLQSIDHCLRRGGEHVRSERIRLLMDCAEICQTSYNTMLSGSPFHMRTCEICAEICDLCAESCEKISDDQMRECAQACRSCAESCRNMISRRKAA